MTGAPLPPLTPEDLGPDPLSACRDWMERAMATSRMAYPDAMCLSTVGEDGSPEGRIVLLKEVDGKGFVFFTNYESTKGRSLELDPRAALTFYWDDLSRQVRVRGEARRISAEESDAYFRTRPRGSQIGAWASLQSRPIPSREALDARAREVEERYSGAEVPRPPHWGGYRLRPAEIEFWQARDSRLHDRIRYRAEADGGWRIERLNP
jgi:pyridoxamine 5'-phosphate oxidase